MNNLLLSFLMADSALIWVPILVGVLALCIGGGVSYYIFNLIPKKKVGNAKVEAKQILDEAISESKTIKKEALLEAKEEILKLHVKFDEEVKERRTELQRSETRIFQKEESLDKKEGILDKKLESLDNTQKEIAAKQADLKRIEEDVNKSHQKMIAELEKIAGLTKEDAKNQIINAFKDEAKKDAASIVRDIENEAKQEGEKRAKDIIGLAIQKCAADHASEVTVSVVPLPNDDMKGRIIGREGRNIRALEQATGIDLIIDDTPEVVILSGFDPIRREVARLSLEKLISDGRIHPARIEEMVEKVKLDVESQIKEAGEAAVFDTGIYGLHPELVKLLGRLKFRTSYGQNVLKHSMEVAFLAGIMAGELGGDVTLAKRAGLLHDIGKAVDFEVEGTHIQIGADLAKKYKENKDVVNAIMAHHGDVDPSRLESVLVAAADAISGSRPGARRESLENYVKRLTKLEEIANSFNGVEKSFAIQAGREIRIIVKPEVVNDANTVFMAKEIAKKIEAEMEYPGQIKVNVIRELRGVEYAK
ncbi:MAG: ribonuclease Y [Firmicutes bacterium]|nr:ribonuclease Y [Bacillota bacterium]